MVTGRCNTQIKDLYARLALVAAAGLLALAAASLASVVLLLPAPVSMCTLAARASWVVRCALDCAQGFPEVPGLLSDATLLRQAVFDALFQPQQLLQQVAAAQQASSSASGKA